MKRFLIIFLGIIAISAILVLYKDNRNLNEGNISLRSPDAEFPTAGACSDAVSGVGIIDINEDIPSPRCIKILKNEKVGFKNRTEKLLEFKFADINLSLKPGEEKIINKDIGEYLEFGVHKVPMDKYAGSGPEIWVVRSRNIEDKLGFIRGIDLNKFEVRFDEARWLTGEEAKDAPDGYFIENNDKSEIVIPLGSIALVKMATYKTGEPDDRDEIIELKEFSDLIHDPKLHWKDLPYKLIIENGIIVLIEEQYIP